MQTMECGACRVEEKLADLDGLVTALRFIGETAEDGELAELRPCAVALLYLMGDAIRNGQKIAGACPRNV